ncbi:30S ribosomal protein S8 [Candidatus Dojkabacteria bacterium]|nr:30S ribosomal protein S8 [Candidatus Dojkabacteria bacterium]
MDTISNMLTKLRNSVAVGKRQVAVDDHKMNMHILEILKSEGFINDFEKKDNNIVVSLLYVKGSPVLTHIERVSRPGQRMYVSSYELKPVLNGRGVGILSTSKGVMSIGKAKAQNLGGEYICKIW